MEAILQEAAAQRAVADLAVHYLLLIEGKTVESGRQYTGILLAGVGGWDKSTDVAIAVWDAPAIRNIGRFSANAHGHETYGHLLPILVYGYAPTESVACEKMAGEIRQFLSTGYKPGS